MKDIKIGAVRVGLFDLGDLAFKLKDVENVPKNVWERKYGELFEKVLLFPTQSALIRAGRIKMIVDPGDYQLFAKTAKEFVPESVTPPPDLLYQLRENGVTAQEITHVVITHLHYDHYAGVTRATLERNRVPSFPNALHFIGKMDWTDEQITKSLKDPNSIESQSVGVVESKGLVRLLEKEFEISDEIRIVPAPGESPGHQIVLVHSEGQALYCVGDLFHHSVEIENPTWMAPWCHPETNLKSRKDLIKNALELNALILASHMSLGRLSLVEKNVKFLEA